LASSAFQRSVGEGSMEVLVGHLGLGHRGLAPQGQDGGVALSPPARVSRRRSTSVSTRLTKNEATLATWGSSSARPAATSASRPLM
jgi:hypothetical protein